MKFKPSDLFPRASISERAHALACELRKRRAAILDEAILRHAEHGVHVDEIRYHLDESSLPTRAELLSHGDVIETIALPRLTI